MPLKERLIDADLLDADDSFARNEFNNPIDQQKGITMRQKPLYRLRIEYGFHQLNSKRDAGTRNSAPHLRVCGMPRFGEPYEAYLGVATDAVAGFLAIELVDESPGDIDAVGSIYQRHLAAINDHVYAALLGEGYQSFTDLFLQRSKYLLPASVVGSLSIFTLALVVFLPLLELIDFLLDCPWLCNGLGLFDLIRELLDLLLDSPLQLSLARLKLSIQSAQHIVESGRYLSSDPETHPNK